MDTGDTGCVIEPVWVEGGGPFGPREPGPVPCVDTGDPDAGDAVITPIVEGDGGLGCAATPAGPAFLALLLLLARRLPFVLLLFALPAQAGVDAQQLQLLEGGDWLALREPTVGLPNTASFSAGIVHARRPVVLAEGSTRTTLLRSVFTREAAVSYTVGRWIQVGAGLPMHRPVFFEGDVPDGVLDEKSRTLGDITLWFAVPLTQPGSRLKATWLVQTDFATGAPEVYLGDPSGNVGGHLALEVPAGPLDLVTNLGWVFAPSTALPGFSWGNRMRYGAGLRAKPGRLATTFELLGSTPAAPWKGEYSAEYPLEALLTLSGRASDIATLFAGVGSGLTTGLGSPAFRAVVGFDVKAHPPEDADLDGIVDLLDACVHVPEDHDGWQDRDGCPELDNDEDGWRDPVDACPNVPETFNDFLDTDGCPDQVATLVLTVVGEDLERAWVTVDGRKTPVLAEDPLTLLVEPAAPTLLVTSQGYGDHLQPLGLVDGDRLELTVTLAPPPPPPEPGDGVTDAGDRLLLPEPVGFTFDSDLVDDTTPLDELAAYLAVHPEIELLRVEGHADEQGDMRYNLELSRRRAEAVLRHLVEQGIDPERLEAIGTGEAKLRDADDTSRRVEFLVLVRAGPSAEP